MHALAFVTLFAAAAHAAPTYQLDPFAQATSGFAGCPDVAPPLLGEDEMRAEAHVRAERGTRCAMDGTCEPGGAYKRDAEVNERVRAAIAGEPRFAKTSIWLTTTRKWVTLEGCVRSRGEKRALDAFVHKQPLVERVFDNTTVGVPKAKR